MVERRKMLQIVAGAAGASAAGVAAIPAGGLALAPAHTPSPHAQGGDGWTTVARLEELPVGRHVQVPVVGAEVDAWSVSADRRLGAVWLLRRGEGADSVQCLSAVCPHLGCLIEGRDDGFNCPCHVSAFSPDGRALTGPSPRAMDPIDVRVEDGNVKVKWVRYRLGVAERVQEG
jgi:Rieske Fe-S protein